MSYFLGMDIGGHNLRAALSDERGEILDRMHARIDRKAEDALVNVDRAARLLLRLLEGSGVSAAEVRGMAAGVPGVTDTETGRVVAAPNVPHWYGLSLGDLLTERLPFPCRLDNDVNMATIGEIWQGAARNCRHFLFLALGTGIGAGVFTNGQLYRGASFGAGEVGYFAFERNRRGRRIGDLGWLESVASGLGIQLAGRRLAESRPDSLLNRLAGTPEKVTSETVFEAAEAGDAAAREIVEEATDLMALAIVNVTALLDPEMVVVGGGVAGQGERLLQPIRAKTSGYGLRIPPIRLSLLGDDAQLLGAVCTALNRFGGTVEMQVVL